MPNFSHELEEVRFAEGSPPSTGTTVDMGRSAGSSELGVEVGRSAMNESRQAEIVSEATVAEAVAGVGMLDGDTQANSGQTEVPLVVCWSGSVTKKKHKVRMHLVAGLPCGTGRF